MCLNIVVNNRNQLWTNFYETFRTLSLDVCLKLINFWNQLNESHSPQPTELRKHKNGKKKTVNSTDVVLKFGVVAAVINSQHILTAHSVRLDPYLL